MGELIYCEFLKLRRSSIWLVCALGTMATPVLVVLSGIKDHFAHPERDVSLYGFYENGLLFSMLLFGPIVFSMITAYLFSREYQEKTLKTLFAVPISKLKFLTGKFIALFLCLLFLMLISWAEVLVLALVCNLAFGISPWDGAAVFFFFCKTVGGSVLLYATVTPFAFLSVYTKGYVVPVTAACIAVLGNVILTNSSAVGFFPWSAAYLLTNGRLRGTGCPPWAAALIILAVCIAGIASSMIYFLKEDIP